MLVSDSNVGSYDDYNFEQSSNCMHIEYAFGMLVKKWTILWSPISVKFERRVSLINMYFHLHIHMTSYDYSYDYSYDIHSSYICYTYVIGML